MITELFLTAVITCSTGQAICSSYETEDSIRVSVCGILTDDAKGDVPSDSERIFQATLDGKIYMVSIRPFCEVY